MMPRLNRHSRLAVLLLFLGVLEGSFCRAETPERPDCEFASRDAAKWLTKARTEFGVAHSVGSLRKVIRRCSLAPASVGTSEGELQRLERRGDQDIYQHGLELLRLGVPVQEQALLEAGRKLGIPSEQVSEAYAQARRAPESSRQACAPVDLRDRLPPVRNQDTVSWCYAYVMADLLSDRFKKDVSAAALAHVYNAEKARNFWPGNSSEFLLEGGSLEGALEAAWSNGGVCTEKDQPSQDLSANRIYRSYLSSIRRIAETHERLEELADTSRFKPELCAEEKDALRAVFPGLATQPMKSILRVLQNEQGAALLGKLAKLSCPDRIKFAQKPRLSIQDTAIKASLHQALDENKLMAITHDASVLYDPRAKPGLSNHTTLVVGRRWNAGTGACEFLIRNSHGPTCDYSPYFQCERGNVWVPASYVEKMTTRTYSLE
jgi:hypothetical protein